MNTTLWRFEALDTWFFRESRPHGSVGSADLNSVFPPPTRVVAGAIRTFIGNAENVNWQKFANNADECKALRERIGGSDDLGALNLRGPFLMHNNERLYPAPLHLLAHFKPNTTCAKPTFYTFLAPGKEATKCDLGTVCLPEIPKQSQKVSKPKPLEDVWLKAADLGKVLQGKAPEKIIPKKCIFDDEFRLGIARNNAQRVVEKSLLYQTQHVRLRENISLGVEVLDSKEAPANGSMRFGGEGRPAAINIQPLAESHHKSVPIPSINQTNLLLMLLTPADFDGNWFPKGFDEPLSDNEGVWRGDIKGIEIEIISACIGKPIREGGWDLVKTQPRAVKGLVPAGSVYFCRALDDPQKTAEALHGYMIGNDTELGRGELAVGTW